MPLTLDMPSEPTYFYSPQYLTLREAPDLSKLPIRRLQIEGEDALELNDLLQVALGFGESTRKLVDEYGTKAFANFKKPADIVEVFGIDNVQATRIVAVMAIGRRLFVRERGTMPTIRSGEDVFEYTKATLGKQPTEHLKVLMLDARYRVFYEQVVAVGGIDNVSISPAQIIGPALERQAVGIILVHNHPSGDSSPTPQDLTFTSKVAEACELMQLQLFDHIIVTADSWSTCLPNASLQTSK